MIFKRNREKQSILNKNYDYMEGDFMKRSEFVAVCGDWDWDDLRRFCNEVGCGYCEDIYSENVRDQLLDGRLEEYATAASGWESLRDELDSIPTGYSWYRYDSDYGEWIVLYEEDLDEYIDDVIGWMDDRGLWECEEENSAQEDDTCNRECEGEDLTLIENEDISIFELFVACSESLKIPDNVSETAKQ